MKEKGDFVGTLLLLMMNDRIDLDGPERRAGALCACDTNSNAGIRSKSHSVTMIHR